MSKRIAGVTRLRSTTNGNPVYLVEFDDGTSGRTVADAQVGTYAENSDWVGVDLDVEWDGDRIRGWKAASLA